MSSVSLFDSRSFFEKALLHGVQHGIIPPEKIAAMNADAPKGMVQIARYFGSEFLRPELEKAKDRMLNLVSLYLEHSTGGDLQRAAESLRDHSFLSRSKGGSDMLKSLIAMPQSSHFGMNDRGGFTDDPIPQLAKWALRPLTDYQLELHKRSQVALVLEAAIWVADTLGLEASKLEEAGKDAEAVLRTALLLQAVKGTDMPDWVAFEKLIATLRKKHAAPKLPSIDLPEALPERFRLTVEAARQSVLADLPKILDATVPARKLFCQTPALMDRYFWTEDMLSEVDHFDRTASSTWDKVTDGHQDDGSLLTLFLCVAAGAAPKTLLTEKGAAALVRKIRKTGLKLDCVAPYIQQHAPDLHHADYTSLWNHFIEDALPTLRSDHAHSLADAVALLKRECNVAG
jgi:hypothetical protein